MLLLSYHFKCEKKHKLKEKAKYVKTYDCELSITEQCGWSEQVLMACTWRWPFIG